MKKLFVALGIAATLAAPAWAANKNIWQYNQYMTIDMSQAKVSYQKGEKVLTFKTLEKFGEASDECTYVYNVDEQTIQLKEMISKTKKSKYVSNYYPENIKTGNAVIKGRAIMANAVLQKVEEMQQDKRR